MLLASVGFLLRLPVVRALHKRQLLFPTVLLIIVAGVLVQGALERNQAGDEFGDGVGALVPVTPPRPIVRADLEKTPLTYFSDYWNQLGGGLGNNFVVERIPEELEFEPGLLEFLEESNLIPGENGTVTAVSPDGTTTVEVKGTKIGVGAFASQRILVTT